MALIRNNISAAYREHNRVRLVQGGSAYFAELLLLVSRAESSIHLQTYIFEWDNTGRQIARALADASARGVEVFLLVDGYASRQLGEPFLSLIASAGVRFRMFEPIWKSDSFYFGRRLHHKVIVVDARYAMVGGVNISDHYNDLPGDPAWLDWALWVEGEVAADLFRLCVDMWVKFPDEVRKIIQRQRIPEPDRSWHCPVRVRRNDWVTGKNRISRSYLEMFRDAKQEITMMSSYFLPGRVFKRNMKRASKRGVLIKLILAGTSDVVLAKQAERYMYRWLFRNKIQVYEYPKNVLHGKIAAYDHQWMTVGSYNVNNISAYASIELNLDVKDEVFASSVHETLEHIIREECVRITEEEYVTHYHYSQRLIQYISYEIVRLIFWMFTFYFRRH